MGITPQEEDQLGGPVPKPGCTSSRTNKPTFIPSICRPIFIYLNNHLDFIFQISWNLIKICLLFRLILSAQIMDTSVALYFKPLSQQGYVVSHWLIENDLTMKIMSTGLWPQSLMLIYMMVVTHPLMT